MINSVDGANLRVMVNLDQTRAVANIPEQAVAADTVRCRHTIGWY